MIKRFLVGLAALCAFSGAQAALQIEITGGINAGHKIAVIPFTQAQGVDTNVASVVSQDLTRSGKFSPIPMTSLPHGSVTDGKINVDDNIKKWVDMSKEQVDAKICGTGDLWGDEWSAGFYPDGKVFCYFGPAWLIDFCMAADDSASIASQGGWGATEGPQGFSWGGTWICAANGTDNPALVADIIRKLTVDTDIMLDIVKQDNDFVNNKPAMEQMAADSSYGDAVLGGQNALAMFAAGADKIDKSNISEYDQGCTESFQAAMKDYFEGNTATYEDALDAFYKSVTEKYPELTY